MEIVDSLDHSVHEHQQHLETLHKISFAPTMEVRPGSVVRVNDRYLVIVISKLTYNFEGLDFMGISTQAPVYDCLKGRKAGE